MNAPAALASTLAPPFSMVSKYFIASILSFVLLCGLMVLSVPELQGHHFQPKLLALTHIATLGWITMIIFGAMFQLVPVVLEVRLFSARLGEVQFWLYTVGTAGLVYGFWLFRVGAHFTASASIVTLAMLLFIINIVATMGRVKQWNLTGLFLLSSLVYLGITAVAGLLLSINLGYPFISRIHLDYLKIHAHMGFIGWVTMVIMGVGLKLIPMFGLSHGFSTKPARAALVLVNVGLLGLSVEWLFTGAEWLLTSYVVILVLGLLAFIVQLILILKHRMRQIFDLGMKHSVVAFSYFLLSIIFGFVLAVVEIDDVKLREGLILMYGGMIMLGFFSMLIVGQMYKIVPFLVWFHTFSDKVGKEPVPMLKDMFSEKVGNVQFWILNAGIVLVLAGLGSSQSMVLTIGLTAMFIASLMVAFNIAAVFRLRSRHGNKRIPA
ncbi:MAG: hypothetical protein WEE20_10040 [Bacteroidota bacterium]